jgi:murein DD-endopeptidase MepM/ murein hydrolase activator NlpD
VDEIAHAPNYYTPTGLSVRPVAGIFVHDTESPTKDAFAYPHPGGSWHILVARDGGIHRFVPDADVAWTVRACDRWHPAWLPRVRPWDASPANCWGLHLELASNAKFQAQGRPYTQAQHAALREVVAHWRALYGPLPVCGHGLVQADRTDPVRLDWAQLHDPLSLWPLAGTARVDPLQGGWGFMQWTGEEYHPGVDLNAGGFCAADAGAGVLAPVAMTVRYVGWHVTSTGRGFGWHLWAQADTGHWLHFCHLQAPPACAVGEPLPRGHVFGLCGKTAGWGCEHLHFEVTHHRPAAWDQWPRGWSKARVEATYLDPFAYLAAASVAPAAPAEEEPMPILNDAQLVAVQAGAWGDLWQHTHPDFAIPTAWRSEVQAGRPPGRPVTGEQPLDDGSGAVVMWFETGRFATYVPGQPVSWNA